jgi:GH15 family glucan-1,4-alpha-glucosidase
VSRTLALLADLREEWVAGAGAVPIEDHALLSDQRTAAIVTPDARVTWLCAPRIDSAAVFAELLGGPPAGFFSVGPVDGAAPVAQRYLDDTLVLETRWAGITVTDYLDVSEGRTNRLAGRTDLVRTVRGPGRARIEFAPRLDFGRYETRLRIRDDGLEVVGAADLMALRAPGVEWELTDDGRHHTAIAEVEIGDDPLVLEFRCGTASLKSSSTEPEVRQAATGDFWSTWAGALDRSTVEPELVERSALTLKALCYGPTGAIVAAPTTSLPESLGGVRNWDYRYCWLRDAALSAAALVRLGSHGEAMGFLDWVLRVLDQRSDDPSRLHPLYLVTGRHLPPEADIAELPGYWGSRPVRVGNAAERQVQLDVFGPIVDLIGLLGTAGAPLSSEHWRLVQAMVGAVEQRWHEPDHGIWEARRPPRHHVYSKTMCWVTVDRALRVADEFVDDDHTAWHDLRSRIADDLLAKGWKEEVGSFTAAYDGTDLDASTLAVGLWGLLEPGDARFTGTVAGVENALRAGPTVYRYHHDDGLPGQEGGFHLMTSWLIDAYLLVGRTRDARDLFADLVDRVGTTGLLSEEYDPEAGRALGNHPQAYSHLGLINNALNLEVGGD